MYMIHGHGGNIYDRARHLGCRPADIIDMSSNVNPLGPPPGLLAHLQEHLAALTALPEVDAAGAVAAFSKRQGVAPQRVLGGNGTTQFIYALPRVLKSRRALILSPTYADYTDACRLNQVAWEDTVAGPATGFVPDMGDVDGAVRAGADTVFICNPNNPTGVLIPSAAIESLCRRHRNTCFVVDESYLPFVHNGESESLAPRSHPNLVVLNSMSKVFRVPGLRIGFAVAPEKIIRALRPHVLPWSVNALAQSAVNYLMTQEPEISNFIRRTRIFLAAERMRLMQRLHDAPSFTLFDSTTSFILVGLGSSLRAHSLCDELAQDRILIRNCDNFTGLSDRYVRISLKNAEANQTLADKLRAIDSRGRVDAVVLNAAAAGGLR